MLRLSRSRVCAQQTNPISIGKNTPGIKIKHFMGLHELLCYVVCIVVVCDTNLQKNKSYENNL